MDIFGHTRSRLAPDHALITPDTHVQSPLIGWTDTMAVVHISPEMGAGFMQYSAVMTKGGKSGSPGFYVERLVYVLAGELSLDLNGAKKTLAVGGFAFIPADTDHCFSAAADSTLIVFEKLFVPIDGVPLPEAVTGRAGDIKGEPFMGDPDAVLQTLLPISPTFDMAVNIFTYQPGATLPQVEIHVMEHGLQMIAGQGVYRLSDNYYPVGEGDVIWMASYCPQWFVAMGKVPASYIYYKDVHRDRLSDG